MFRGDKKCAEENHGKTVRFMFRIILHHVSASDGVRVGAMLKFLLFVVVVAVLHFHSAPIAALRWVLFQTFGAQGRN